jgi:hypothetical protein
VTEKLKRRTIRLGGADDNPDRARSAARLLRDVKGITEVHIVSRNRLVVRYNVRQITLQIIEALLREFRNPACCVAACAPYATTWKTSNAAIPYTTRLNVRAMCSSRATCAGRTAAATIDLITCGAICKPTTQDPACRYSRTAPGKAN